MHAIKARKDVSDTSLLYSRLSMKKSNPLKNGGSKMPRNIAVVILAAGKGTRMKSNLPKVLHKIGGKSMLEEVLSTAEKLNPQRVIVVVGFGANHVKAILPEGVIAVEQVQQLGTGHAMMQAMPALEGFNGSVVTLYGDVPLLTLDTLNKLLDKHTQTDAAVTVLTALLEDPSGYGRIVRNGEIFDRIVEDKDASLEEKKIKEINSGVYCFSSDALEKYLPQLTPQNKQGEYYLTDILELAKKDNKVVETFITNDSAEILGANNRVQLAELAQLRNQRKLQKLMISGVTIFDPNNTYIDDDVEIEPDTIIQPGTFLYGNCRIGSGSIIGPYTTLVNVEVGSNVVIERSVVEEAKVQQGACVGPFSHIRPGSIVCQDAKIGNYVELKNSTVGKGSKASHLTYLGDTILGENVNIGAGTITCNYNGQEKFPTEIDDNAFIGSNSSLVAPVKIGKNAVTGAGSTITKDVPSNALAVGRGKQVNYKDWVLKKKIKRKEFKE